MSEIDDAQAHEIVVRLLSAAPEHIAKYQPQVGGDDSHSFCLRVDGQLLLLKIKKKPATPIGVVFYERIREAGIPVPDLVAFAPHAGPNGEACALWSWVEGRPAHWAPGEPCPYDEAEFGQLLPHPRAAL